MSCDNASIARCDGVWSDRGRCCSLAAPLPLQVGASVRNLLTDSVHFWDLATIRNRVGLMHELYQQALKGEAMRPTTVAALEDDPFYDPHLLQLVGRAVILTKSLLEAPHSADMNVPIYSDKVAANRLLLAVVDC
jgi:Kinesin protein 1B